MQDQPKIDHAKILSLLLIFCMLIMYKTAVWDRYFNKDKIATTGTENKSQQPTSTPVVGAAASNAAAPAITHTGYPSDSEVASAGDVSVFTNRLQLKVSLLGARLTEVLLNEYKETKAPDSPAFELIKHAEFMPYPLGVYAGGLDDSRVQYQVASVSKSAASRVNHDQLFEVGNGEKFDLTLTGKLSDGRTITKKYHFTGDDYRVDLDVELSAPNADKSPLELEWTKYVVAKEETVLDAYNLSGFGWFDGEKAKRKNFSAFEENELALGKIRWVSLSDKYFTGSLIATDKMTDGRVLKSDANLYRGRIAGDDVSGKFAVFLGPKSYRLLQAQGFEMQRNLDLGKTALISAPLLSLLHFLYGIFGNYGLAIVALTILVKGLLYPLTAASFKSMKAMQDLQPEMKRLRETIKDKTQQQQELMALYKKRGVNPMGGCLPMFLQMPIFIGLYSSLMLAIELRHAPFGFWIQDLSAKEQLMVGSVGIPVMVLLMVISMLIQQWTTPSTMDPAQKRMMMFMPLVFGFMFMKFPAGLALYWLTNNLISIGQQRGMQKNLSDRKALQLTAAVSMSVFALAWIFVKLGN